MFVIFAQWLQRQSVECARIKLACALHFLWMLLCTSCLLKSTRSKVLNHPGASWLPHREMRLGFWARFWQRGMAPSTSGLPQSPPSFAVKYNTISFHKRSSNGTESRANCYYCQEGPLRCPLKQEGTAEQPCESWAFEMILAFCNLTTSWCFSNRQIPVQTRARALPLPLRRRHLPPQERHARRHIQGEESSRRASLALTFQSEKVWRLPRFVSGRSALLSPPQPLHSGYQVGGHFVGLWLLI